MNERIKEIGKQLGMTDIEGKFYSPNYEILAEFIVQECVKEFKASYKYGDPMAKMVVKDAANHVKKHFGVR